MAKKEYYFMQPKYYKKFHCLCGECSKNCCEVEWNIYWGKENVEKLKASAPQDILDIAAEAFVPMEQGKTERAWGYIVKPKDGKCPFLTEDKMCYIQRTMGAEYLSDICICYPRHMVFDDSRAANYLAISCPEVLRLVMDDEDSMDAVSGKIKIKEHEYLMHSYNEQMVNKKPELQYIVMITEFFYDVIYRNSRKSDIDSAVVQIVAMAESIQKLIDHRTYDEIPRWIQHLREQSKEPLTIEVPSNKDECCRSKCGIMTRLFNALGSYSAIGFITDENGYIDQQKYNEAKEKFDEYDKENSHMLRNITLNILLETFSAGLGENITLFERSCYFAVWIMLIKDVGAICSVSGDDFKTAFCQSLTTACGHTTNKDYMNKVIAILKETNTLSVSGIALLLKF